MDTYLFNNFTKLYISRFFYKIIQSVDFLRYFKILVKKYFKIKKTSQFDWFL